MIATVKIPEERVSVLIGTKGSTKRNIQRQTKTKIIIEGEEVTIDGDSINALDAENIVKAIGRGFSPENSFLLLDEENTLSIIDLPKNKATLKRVRSRLIGTNGKSRRNIERLTGTHISVYGKTVSLIGEYSNVEIAEQAINKLIKGVSHRFVYEFLEARQDERA